MVHPCEISLRTSSSTNVSTSTGEIRKISICAFAIFHFVAHLSFLVLICLRLFIHNNEVPSVNLNIKQYLVVTYFRGNSVNLCKFREKWKGQMLRDLNFTIRRFYDSVEEAFEIEPHVSANKRSLKQADDWTTMIWLWRTRNTVTRVQVGHRLEKRLQQRDHRSVCFK